MFWITAFRVVIGLASILSFLIMLVSYFQNHRGWNAKTLDYWYGRMVWTVVGMSSSIEGLIRHTPFRYTLVLIAVAVLVTLKGNLQKGRWGTASEKEEVDDD